MLCRWIAAEHHQVTFASPYFVLVFVPVASVFVFVLSRFGTLAATFALIIVSLGFYASWGIESLAVLSGSIVINYLLRSGLILAMQKGNPRTARCLLVLTVLLNLSVLFFFKYLAMFAAALSGSFSPTTQSLWLPLGISFFTFQEITLAVDAYKGNFHRSLVRYVAFITFFPHLIAGPLLHHAELIPQMGKIKLLKSNIALGLTIFAAGMFKKVCLADPLAPVAALVFDSAVAPGFADAWIGALAYAMQLYFDFSGYSDMAIGLALLFNIKLPVNFNSPYKSTSIIEFWRRWHMTLSRFLREYIYIPLGGNRLGGTRRYLNVFLVMLIGGAWHGANWTFVVWGALHGILLLVNHAWREYQGIPRRFNLRIGPTAGRVMTFVFVLIAWVPFRAPSIDRAVEVWAGMLGLHGFPGAAAAEFQGAIALLFALLFAVQILPNTAEVMLAGRSTTFGYPAVGRWCWRPRMSTSILVGIALGISLSASIHGTKIFLYWNF